MVDHAAKKRTAVRWTPEGEKAFDDIKDLVSRCPLLHFVDDKAPITLMTDASDYGIGGYLYQVVEGTKHPVAFISKSLTEIQLRWSVIQKEAYAIFFCCSELDNLLRDRRFKIRTDHANLTFLQNDSNQMVIRWYVALQELDYVLEFVPGKENEIADWLSRLCPNLLIPAKNITRISDSEVMSAIIELPSLSHARREAIQACHNSVVGHGGKINSSEP
jgi:hypothetical protein